MRIKQRWKSFLTIGILLGGFSQQVYGMAYLKGPVEPGEYYPGAATGEPVEDDLTVWFDGSGNPSTVSNTAGTYLFTVMDGRTIRFTGQYQNQGNQSYLLSPSNSQVTINAKEIYFSDATVKDWSWSNDANGISSRMNSKVILNGNTYIQNIKAYTQDISADSEALEVSRNSFVEINGNLSMSGLYSTTNMLGFSMDNNAKVHVTGNTQITDLRGSDHSNTNISSQSYVYGAQLLSNSQVTLDKDLAIGTITSTHGKGYGISAGNAGSIFSVAGNTEIVSLEGEVSVIGLEAFDQGQIDFGQDFTLHSISSSGGDAIALSSSGEQSEINIGGNVKIDQIDGEKNAIGIQAVDGGSVLLKKGVELKNIFGEAESWAISASGENSSISVNSLDSASDTKIIGDIRAVDQGSVDIRMNTDASYLTGNIFGGNQGNSLLYLNAGIFTGFMDETNRGEGTEGKVEIRMKEAGIWNMTGNWNGDLVMDGGELRFYDEDSFAYMTILGDGQIQLNEGTIHFETDIGNLQGDQFVAVQGLRGSGALIDIENNGVSPTNGTERLDLIYDKNYTETEFSLTHLVDQGGYSYQLFSEEQGQEKIWYLGSDKKKPTNPGNAGPHLFGGNYLLNIAETSTLMKRMGELRTENWIKNGNVWARMHGGNLEVSGDAFLRNYDMNYWGIQIGMDKEIGSKESESKTYLGGMFGYTKGNLDYGQGGSGSADSKTLGMYFTHTTKNDFYVDAIVKYGWLTNDYSVRDSAGVSVIAKDIHTEGVSLSVELGKKYYFASKEKGRFYVEPQTQLTVSHQDGASFIAENGLRTKIDSFHSVLGRMGARIGYEAINEKNPINFYAKWDWIKEFEGNMDFSLNGSEERTSYKGSWYVWGIGATAQLGEKHHVYLELERSGGGKIRQSWGINGGYRFVW